MNKTEALQRAFKNLLVATKHLGVSPGTVEEAEAALAQPAREWVGLTDEQIEYFCYLAYTGDEEFLLAVQAKLKELNHE